MVQEVADILQGEVWVMVRQGCPEPCSHGGKLGLVTRQKPAGLVRVLDRLFQSAKGIDGQAQDPGTAIRIKGDRPQAGGATYDQVGTPVTLNLAVRDILSAMGISVPNSVMKAAKTTVLVPSGKVIL